MRWLRLASDTALIALDRTVHWLQVPSGYLHLICTCTANQP